MLRKLLILLVILSLMTGCATTGRNVPNTSCPSTEKDAQSQKVETEGTVTGMAIGTVAGTVAGAVLGGRKGAVVGAIFGWVAGTIIGNVAGKSVASRMKAYKNEEERLAGETKLMAENNQKLQEYNSKIQTNLASLEQECDTLRSRYATNQVELSALKKKERDIRVLIKEGDEQKSAMTEEASTLEKYVDGVHKSNPGYDTAALEKEINQLRVNIATLDSNSNQMAQLAESLTIRK